MECRSVLGFIGCLAVSCGPTVSISADDYNRTCSTAVECVVVVDGNPCSACYTALATINESAVEQFSADKEALGRTCPPPNPLDPECPALPRAHAPLCVDGTCAIPVNGELCPIQGTCVGQ